MHKITIPYTYFQNERWVAVTEMMRQVAIAAGADSHLVITHSVDFGPDGKREITFTVDNYAVAAQQANHHADVVETERQADLVKTTESPAAVPELPAESQPSKDEQVDSQPDTEDNSSDTKSPDQSPRHDSASESGQGRAKARGRKHNNR